MANPNVNHWISCVLGVAKFDPFPSPIPAMLPACFVIFLSFGIWHACYSQIHWLPVIVQLVEIHKPASPPKRWEYNLSHVATIFPGRLWFLSVGTTTHDSQQSMAPAAVDLTTEDLLPCPAGTYEEGWRSTYGRGNIWNISNTILLFPPESTRIWILDFGNQRIWDGNQWIWGPWVGKHAFQLTWTIWTKVQWDRSGNRCQWAFLPFLPFLPFLRREIAATRRLLVGQLRFGGFGGTVGGAKPWCAGGPGGPGAHGSLLDPP